MSSLIVIGGGAAGFFGAIRAAELLPGVDVTILEKSPQLLSKVRISGGGRCNVTHACFDPAELVRLYPRGSKELRGPFSRFQPGDTFEWFESRGVPLKTEDDGRVFPVTDRSQTIIDCFNNEASRLGVKIETRSGVQEIRPMPDHRWQVAVSGGKILQADALLVTAGSSEQMWHLIAGLGHSIVPPVPSLFTFNCADSRISALPGITAMHAQVQIEGTPFSETGPVLITHWGFSGPGILKLSARAARDLATSDYRFRIIINWDASRDTERLFGHLASVRSESAKKQLGSFSPVHIPQRLWESLVSHVTDSTNRWADTGNETLRAIASQICECTFDISGKSTFKEEFVTAGGVSLREIDFKTMESRVCPNLWFAGEVLDIDAVTGGFNFQSAWTTSWIAGTSIAERLA